MPRKRHAPRAKGKTSAEKLAALLRGDWREEVVRRYMPRICECLQMLSDEEIWWRPNEASNSVGNLVLHPCGNMRQWIVAGLGGDADIRQRDLEFSEKGPIPRDELTGKFVGIVTDAARVVARLSPDALAKKYSIQGYRKTGYEAMSQVQWHFTYHAGQIVYVTKMKRGQDLGFTKLAPLKPTSSKTPAKHRTAPRP